MTNAYVIHAACFYGFSFNGVSKRSEENILKVFWAGKAK